MEKQKFEVILLAIIFDPKKKKILIARRDHDDTHPNLTWFFPGPHANKEEDIDKTLKKGVKERTGYDIKNLGAFFSKTYSEKPELLAVYFLTQVFEGEEKLGPGIKEIKWISPKDIDKYFTNKFHPKLKKFLVELI